jgi:hypothetical protein
MDAGSIPTVTLPAGAPWWAYLLATLAPVAATGLYVLHKHLERSITKPAEVTCAECTGARADIAALRADVAGRFERLHAATRQIADLQHADSKVLESVAEKADEQARQLASIDKTVTLIDRDSFRREPTR